MRFKLKRPIKIWRFWRLHVFGKHEVIKCGNNCHNLGLLLHTRPTMIQHFIWFSLQYDVVICKYTKFIQHGQLGIVHFARACSK